LLGAPFDEDDLVAAGEIFNWPDDVRVGIACDGEDELDPYVFAARGILLHYVTSRTAFILEGAALRGLQLLALRPTASSPCGIDGQQIQSANPRPRERAFTFLDSRVISCAVTAGDR
jgi:hypothetical protein